MAEFAAALTPGNLTPDEWRDVKRTAAAVAEGFCGWSPDHGRLDERGKCFKCERTYHLEATADPAPDGSPGFVLVIGFPVTLEIADGSYVFDNARLYLRRET